MKQLIITTASIVVLSLIVLVVVTLLQAPNVKGSTIDGQAYAATTTDATWAGAKTVKAGQGILGSVVLTKSTASTIKIYDATTTDILKRTGNTATSTITVVDIAASAPAGTYTYDIQLNYGLIIEPSVATGVASSTITYR
jgi:hypothetical protein